MTTDIAMTTDEALISALSPKRLEELELQPYSLARQTVALDICPKNGGPFCEGIITVWVCTLSETEALNCYEDITKARLDAFAWGQARGYSVFNFKPLFDIYTRLKQELAASTRAQLKSGDDGDAPKNDGGRAG
jgi:hypothetical protein